VKLARAHDDADLSVPPSAGSQARDETLAFYESNACSYSRSTRRLSMAPQLERFATALQPGAAVLDLGCGSGRDLAVLKAAGFRAVGLDISPQLAAIAREGSGCQVLVGDMRNPPFRDWEFDGIWAAASLLHLQRDDVVPALGRLRRLLVPRGRFFASVKAGVGEERTSDGRWFTYFQPHEWQQLLAGSGFGEIQLNLESDSRPADSGWIQSFAVAQ